MSNCRLDSWKSIAAYFDRGVRTVQRWHVDHGMPVHHFGGTKGCVFAYSENLDRWLAEHTDASGAEMRVLHPAVEAKKTRSHELTASADAMWDSHSERNLPTIAALYREAIDESPDNYAALIGLSRALISSALMGIVDSSVAYPSAMEALRRVPQRDSCLLDARSTAAWLNMVYERRWKDARAGFDDVLREAPQHAHALSGRALLHLAEGNICEAFQCASQAWSLNPLATPLSFFPCWAHYLNGDYEEALELASQSRASGADTAMISVVEALALMQSGPIGLSIRRIEDIAAGFPQCHVLLGVLGYSYALCGQREKAREIVNRYRHFSERKKRNREYSFALVLLGLNEKKEALALLDSAYEDGALWSLGFHLDPLLRSLRGDQHFESLLQRIGSAN